MRSSSRFSGVFLVAALQACASAGAPAVEGAGPSGGSGAMSSEPAAAAAKGTANYITEEEFRDAPYTLSNAYDVIARLRPAMLQSRITPTARGSASLPVLFADNRRLGEIGILRGIAREVVREVRYFTAAEARGKFGEGVPGGVIQLIAYKQAP